MYETQTDSYYQFYAVQNVCNRCVLFLVMREHNHDLCGCVTDCIDVVEIETGSCSDTCAVRDVDGTEEVGITVEEAIDTTDEIPQPTSFPPVKNGDEVWLWGVCVCVCVVVVTADAFRTFIAPKKKL